jgi:predicted DNA-binding WGR domain protein
MRHFEFRGGKSAKFWSIDLQGKKLTIRFGRIGTAGQTQTREFANETEASRAHDKLVIEKRAKGYLETTPGAAPAATPAAPRSPKRGSNRPAVREFVLDRQTPKKWWAIRLSGRSFWVAHGLDHGDYWTTDNTRTEFPNKTKAEKEHDRLMAKKVADGYVEVAPLRSKKLARGNAGIPDLRYFVRGKGTPKQWWAVCVRGRVLLILSGRCGNQGISWTGVKSEKREYASQAAARAEHDRLVAEKVGQGYIDEPSWKS